MMNVKDSPKQGTTDRLVWLTSPPAKKLKRDQHLSPSAPQPGKGDGDHEEEISEIVELIGVTEGSQSRLQVSPGKITPKVTVFTEESLKTFGSRIHSVDSRNSNPKSTSSGGHRFRRAFSHGVTHTCTPLQASPLRSADDSGSSNEPTPQQLITRLASTIQPVSTESPTTPHADFPPHLGNVGASRSMASSRPLAQCRALRRAASSPQPKRSSPRPGLPNKVTPVPTADSTPVLTSTSIDPVQSKKLTYERYLVLQVTVQYYQPPLLAEDTFQTTHQHPEKVLWLFDELRNVQSTVHLRDDWCQTPVEVGDYVHLVGPFADKDGLRMLDNSHGLVVLHPDCLISSTHLANAFVCLRRSVLQDRVVLPRETNIALLHGSLLHRLLQTAIRVNDFSTYFLTTVSRELITQSLHELFFVQETEAQAMAHLKEWGAVFQQWAELYISPVPRREAMVKWHGGGYQRDRNSSFHQQPRLAIQKVLDIEEHVWSPMYGLKGKIDITVQAMLTDGQGPPQVLVLPLELKTSKSSRSIEHRTQLILYTLLLTDRYDIAVENGLLYYLKTRETIVVPAVRDDLRNIMIKRNEMATFITGRWRLPPMIQNPHICRMCPILDTCLVYHKALEHGTAESSGLGAVFTTKCDSLTPRDVVFFDKWENLVTVEEAEMFRFRKEIWSMTAPERQGIGRCFGGMVVLAKENEESMVVDGMDRFRYRLARNIPSSTPQSGMVSGRHRQHNLLDGQLNVGDPVVVSSEQGHFALAVGFVLELAKCTVVVSLDRPLRGVPLPVIPFDPRVRQQYQGIMEVSFGRLDHNDCQGTHGQGGSRAVITRLYSYVPSPLATGWCNEDPFLQHLASQGWASGASANSDRSLINGSPLVIPHQSFRVDKDELTTGMGTIRYNLIALLGETGDARRRRLVVNLEAPRFDCHVPGEASTASSALTAPGSPVLQLPELLQDQFAMLNIDQRQAVDKVLHAQDYALILGMPGTGKTSTIAFIVQALVASGKTVLLTSYTHTAVDNILLKLHTTNVPILRLGNRRKVHPAIQPFVPNLADFTTVDQVEQLYTAQGVVATTCLGISHPLFQRRTFDYCIVDEASQITLPVCLGPLRFADTFILVGDHYQLPPLVRTTEARLQGLAVSLFKQLSEAHPEAVVKLEHQYRMNSDIMCLSNHLVYDYRLRCGTMQVADWVLEVPNLRALDDLHFTQPVGENHLMAEIPCPWVHNRDRRCWLQQVLEPTRSVVFLNTDSVPAPEVRVGELVHNPVEATLVSQIVETLMHCGLTEDSLGVIAPYKAQLKLLQHQLHHRPDLEIHTVDKYQGRDKDCIIMTFVRANPNHNIGELLKDWRRINVALTRARKKLILVGSIQTLQNASLYMELVTLVNRKKWIIPLPLAAHQNHVFPSLLNSEAPNAAAETQHNSTIRDGTSA
ncbi:DNA replication endonuclease-helicase Dna2 [Dispira simplex]|nr:DNA replication endonuclease-helicase Dna2 [Dispira simplex]